MYTDGSVDPVLKPQHALCSRFQACDSINGSAHLRLLAALKAFFSYRLIDIISSNNTI